MIVIQHAAPMVFQERFALLSVSRKHHTDKIFVATRGGGRKLAESHRMY